MYAKSIQQDNFPEEESQEDPLVQAVPGTEISEEAIIIIGGQCRSWHTARFRSQAPPNEPIDHQR